MSKKRVKLYDFARALCALHIIITWHGVAYFYPDSIVIKLGTPMTIASLACFTFLSGLFNNIKNGIASFYKSRVRRLYVPFVISYFLLVAIGLNDMNLKDSILSLTGLSCFFGGQPNTLWYICMLLIFYALTPLLLFNSDRGTKEGQKKIALKGAAIFVIFYLADRSLPYFETRILYYFPFYVLGLILHPQKIQIWISLKRSKYIWLFSSVVFLGLTVLLSAVAVNKATIAQLFICLSYGFWGTILFLTCSEFLSYLTYIGKILVDISYSSMFAYLFHRVIFFFCIGVLLQFHPMVVLIVGSVLSFICSFWIQKWYDNVINYKFKK